MTGAQCGSSARWDLRGGPPAMAVPTATEDKGGAGYLGDPAGACGDVLEDGPALGEQGEPSFSPAAQVAQQGVPGAGAGVRVAVSRRVFQGDEDADAGALVAAVGEARHSERGGPVECGQGVPAGGGDVVDRPR